MIPPPDPVTGNLPPGVHVATWEEVLKRFGYTEHRRQLLAGLRKALDALWVAGCRTAYLDGSFVSTKEVPGDFDACWDTDGVDVILLSQAASTLFDLRPGRIAQKTTYGGELFPATMVADASGKSILDYFQRDKLSSAPKGIIVLNLGELP